MLAPARYLYGTMRDRALSLLFERSSGVETNERVVLDSLGLGGEGRISYTPSNWLALRRALPRRSVEPDDVFIDYGSGKGRVVLQAARYPLERVIGLELAEPLNAIARANLERRRERLACRDVELITADVLDYEPPDDVTIAYLYNPFRGDIFATAIERLIASVDRNPRRLRLIYVNPIEHELLIGTGRARLVRQLRAVGLTAAFSRSASTHVYEIEPVAAASAVA